MEDIWRKLNPKVKDFTFYLTRHVFFQNWYDMDYKRNWINNKEGKNIA